jgi:phage shock protein E
MRMHWAILVLGLAAVLALLALKHGGLASATTVAALLPQNPLLLDVRTEAEFNRGHLAGTRNVPLADLAGQIAQWAPDRSRPILLHCASGARSGAGRKILQNLGYTNVHNLGSQARAEVLLNPGR